MESATRQLDESGFALLPGLMPPDLLAAFRARTAEILAEEGAEAGGEFKREPGAARLANLVDKGEIFEKMLVNPAVLRCVSHVLGPDFKLGSLNYRAADPHEGGLQPLHVDMGLLADESGYRVCNTIWLLDDFTAENGATRAVPGSHNWRRRPQDALADPSAAHPQEALVLGKAGDVAIMNSHTWHGGTTNRTGEPRRALHLLYVRRDVPQQQYQKKLLRAETQRGLTAEVRRMLALDDPMNDELNRSGVQLSGFLK